MTALPLLTTVFKRKTDKKFKSTKLKRKEAEKVPIFPQKTTDHGFMFCSYKMENINI